MTLAQLLTFNVLLLLLCLLKFGLAGFLFFIPLAMLCDGVLIIVIMLADSIIERNRKP